MKVRILLTAVLFMAAAASCFAATTLGRTDTVLNLGWRFIRQDVPGADQPEFNDSAWTNVDLPHCWSIQAGQDNDWKAVYPGVSWYRRHVTISSTEAGRKLYLRFEGAYVVTDVFVNGSPAGHHVGGFAAFCFDVTRLLKVGADNVISVKVHGNLPAGSAPPQGGDFTKFAGLYRSVHLLSTYPVSVSPLVSASPGVFLKQRKVGDDAADVDANVVVSNGTAAPASPSVRIRVVDAGGKQAATATIVASLQAGQTTSLTLPVHITKPHLWDAGNDPYLYRAVVEVLDGTKVLDRVDQLLGLRYFSVDPAKGFSLNGKSYPLHGVSRHQDRLDKGWAISDADTEQDVSLIREVGATCLRTAHYQQSDDLYSLCDRAGIVVWTELCMVNNVGRTEEFKDNAKQQLEELIRQNYNHPSICFWSLWNEIAFVGGKGPNQDDLAFLTSLNETAKSLDPTRLTVAANNAMSVQRYAAPITDLIGWNLYPGWYGGKPGEFGGTLSDIEKNIPGHAVAFSEYGAGGSIYQHGAETTPPSPGGLYHPEEWQAKIHEADWKFLSSRSDLWATFVWNMFDFASLGRNEGDHPGRNDKGLVTYDRAVRKDAFYFYQAQWSKTLMARITSERYNPRPTGPAEVKVYSNGDQVDLNVNGRSAGIKSGEAGVFKWNVTLPAGEVRVEAIATRGTRKASDVAVWTCSPTAPPRIGPPDPPKQTGAG